MRALRFFIAILIISPLALTQELSIYSLLLKKVDSLVTFNENDLSAEYTIVKRDPGGSSSTTVATMFRRDRTDQFLILILEPDIDKGKGYLKLGDNLWLFDPVGKTFTFTSAKERFQNSSARNSDFNRSNFSLDYQVLSGRQEKLGVFNCTVLELKATNDRVSFPKVVLWISDDGLVRQLKDYSLSGQLMRTSAMPSYQKVGNRWIPSSLVILDNLKSKTIQGKTEFERTTITISKPSLIPLPDTVYTKEYLEKVNKAK
jgi:outer membrane lipoprotein-sorting protein